MAKKSGKMPAFMKGGKKEAAEERKEKRMGKKDSPAEERAEKKKGK